jgi:hypothetical protein
MRRSEMLSVVYGKRDFFSASPRFNRERDCSTKPNTGARRRRVRFRPRVESGDRHRELRHGGLSSTVPALAVARLLSLLGFSGIFRPVFI